ncbi:MAG: tRNA3(Ser)-specific nuclease WapA precursor [Candidatus Latescibacteria bacterium ADurb.Bin168]|nr:MAG: tRNA3(Ser)-specific nuclease WapA precursor [Candidatus Latescibacteria bacterium ADurb.Bin168]
MTVHQPDVRTYYYIKDHLGSVLALTDESGALVESYSYDAWGRVLGVYDGGGAEIAESSVGNRILWQGREYSWSTGLYYFRARWYDPVTGRWLSNDPIGILGGLNQYVFCANNSVNMADPRGLDVWLINDPDATPAHGHSAVIIGQNGVFVYFSFGPSDDSGSSGRYTGAVNGSLATQGFTSLAAALRYAKSQGYGRYAHYKTDPCADAAGTRAAGAFANACFHGSVNNCQILVNAVMSAMGVIFSGTSDPNYSYQRNRSQADDWGGL